MKEQATVVGLSGKGSVRDRMALRRGLLSVPVTRVDTVINHNGSFAPELQARLRDTRAAYMSM